MDVLSSCLVSSPLTLHIYHRNDALPFVVQSVISKGKGKGSV